jgi:predicted sulfurtransferase
MNKKSLFALLSLLSTTTLQAQTISPEDYLRQLVETKNEYLVDVRTAQEFTTEHLNNAINIDFNSPEFEIVSLIEKGIEMMNLT